jgi:hypothetical protein
MSVEFSAFELDARGRQGFCHISTRRSMLGLAYSVPSVLRIRIEPDPSRDLEGRLFFIGKGGDVT